MPNIIQDLEKKQLRSDIPEFSPGDTLVVQVKVKEGTENVFKPSKVVIAMKNRGLNSSFTVRKISHGEGVERYSKPLVH